MSLESRYRSLLRWYPRAWRSSDGEVLIGTLLDVAEAEDRSFPTAAEARSIRWTGLGERFTVMAALIATMCALAAAVAHTAVVMFGVSSIAQVGGGWIPATLGQFLIPLLLSFAALCLLRHSRIILPGRAVAALLCAVLAWMLAATAAVSWSVRFDEADAGGIASPLALAFLPLFAAAWVVGGCAFFLVTHAMLRKLPRGAQWAAAGSVAVLTPPVLGVAMISPMTTALGSVALLFICGFMVRPGRAAAAPTPLQVTVTVRRRVGFFAIVTLVISVVSAAFALTGSTWTMGIDSTRAMQLGLSAGQLCSIPLLFSVGWICQDRRPVNAARRWLPILSLTLGVTITALDTVIGFTRSGNAPWPGIVLIAIGLAITIFQMLRMTGIIRVVLAAAAGLALFALVGVVVVMLGLFVPLAAGVLMIWGLRRPRPRTAPAVVAST